MRYYIFFAGLAMFCMQAAAQSNHKISGVVADVAKQPLAGAKVMLYKTFDTAFTQQAAAGKSGGFVFKGLAAGRYIVSVSFVGYQPYTSPVLSLDSSHPAIIVPLIALQPSGGGILKNVQVNAKKPLIEQKADRTIVNVDAMITAAGSNALEVLGRSPGVSVNANDDISLNGKNNVLVLVDDRLTYMPAQALAAYLKSLPAGMLDRVELISNPPARYEANGNAIINIVLKKNLAAGFNGSLNIAYNQGIYARTNNAMNINCRTGKLNIFGNIGYSSDKNFSEQSFNRYFYTGGSFNKQILQNSFFKYQSSAWNVRAGIDWFTSPKTTLGFIFTGNTRPRSDLLTYTSAEYNSAMQADSTGKGITSGSYDAQTYGINLNMQHKLNNSGKVLAVNADVLRYHNTGSQIAPVDNYLPDGTLARHEGRFFTLPSDVDIYATKADYTLPLHGKAQVDAGIKTSYVVTENAYNWFDQPGDSLLQDYSKSNHFKYAENVNSAYISARKEWARWTVQAGLRAEQINATGRQLGNPAVKDSAFDKHYTSLFPSLFLLYKLDSSGNNTLVLSFSRRISRPSYQQLNPFLFFRDPYTYNGGNPGLVPSYAQYIELRYSYKGYFGVTLSYGGGNNGINAATQADGDVFVTRPMNYLDSRMGGIIPYCSLRPFKWWSFTLNGVFLWQRLEGHAGDVQINQHNTTHEIETSNQFTISTTWSVQVDCFFPGRQTFGQSKNGSVYNVSAGLQKKIMHGNGAIHLNINNIFNSLAMHSQTIGISGANAFSTRSADDRRIGISFTCNVGKTANARKRSDAGSAEEEKGRAN